MLNPLMLTFLKGMIPYGVAAAVGFAGAWWMQGLRITSAKQETREVQQTFDNHIVEQEKFAIEAQRAALKREAELKHQVEVAQNEANDRDRKLKALAASSAASSTSLRNTIQLYRDSLSGGSIEAYRKAAETFAAVFDDCQEKYRSMAEAAAGHESDVETLEQAWPK